MEKNRINEVETEIKVSRFENIILLLILPTAFLILAFIFDSPKNILLGLYNIVVSRDILLTDYLEIGGLGATLVNSSLLAFINIYIIYKLKLKINGAIIAALYTIMGFSFIGKNIFNVWPMYIGGYLYVNYHKIEFKNIIVIIMFSTCLAPTVSEITFSSGLPLNIGLLAGILCGIIAGFIITPLSSNMIKLHDGYNLYNIGFTAGILGTLIFSIMKSFGINVKQQLILSYEYDLFLKIILFVFCILLIAIGFIISNKSFKNYSKILKFSGKLVTDFTQLVGIGTTLINMGVMGLVCMFFVHITSGVFNGPIVGGIITAVGFSAFGNHPKNSIPIMIGVFLAGVIKIWDINSTQVIIAGLFGTTLAPIAGKYGFFAGIFAGFLHLSVVMNVGIIHGGIILYNNGFAGGLVAGILFPLFEAFKKED